MSAETPPDAAPERFPESGPPWTQKSDAEHFGLVQVDLHSGRILHLNERFASLLDAVPAELPGRRFVSLIHPDERTAWGHGLQRLARGEIDTFETEQRLLRRDKEAAWTLLVVNLLRETVGDEASFVVTVLEIGTRQRAEQALMDSEGHLQPVRAELEHRVAQRATELASANAALLNEIAERRVAERRVRELLTRMVEDVEDERRRISRELHDTLGQHLAVLSIGLKAMEEDLTHTSAARARLARVQRALHQIEDKLDRIAHELRPPALDDLGLEEAMRSHVDTWSNESGIAAELHTQGIGRSRLPPAVENTVYRAVQEALTNVRKHASASRVGIIIERRLDELRVVVEDDGCGFDRAQVGRPGGRQLGLRGMGERAALVGGSLEIESLPGRGTTIYLAIPLGGVPDVEVGLAPT